MRGANRKVEIACSERAVLGESPVWCGRSRRLYWVDVRRPCLWGLDPLTGAAQSWSMPEVVAAVVLRGAGGVVLSMKSGLHAFDPETGQLSLLLAPEAGPPDNRLNDTKCDRAGNLWCGTMWDFGRETTGSLYRVSPDLEFRQIRAGITVPNALAFSPDNRTMYFADTPTGCLERAELDASAGTIGPWEVMADASAAPGRPDGATVDAEGFIWNARYTGGCLARFAPDGRLVETIDLPVSRPTSCAFGGSELKTLYVTTARQGLGPDEVEAEPWAGMLLALDVDTRGLPEPRFAG